MISQPIIQTILNVVDGRYGLRYLKIVKSPSGPHYIVDVMFKRGFRLTADVIPGHHAKGIGEELDAKLQAHRPGEYETIHPAIEFVADCASRALSDEHGVIIEKHLHEDLLKEAWEMTTFRRLLKSIDPKAELDYEKVEPELQAIFKMETTDSANVPSDQ